MKSFNSRITLNKNSRGCYILDTVKGCSVCGASKPLGCYDDCYAKKIASRYGLDFTRPVSRGFDHDNQIKLFDFTNGRHIVEIIKEIKKIAMPFVRIGEMGDPSENWEHTIRVCEVISEAGKPIVIITKHWKTLTNEMLERLSLMNICINTSISALDSVDERIYRLEQYRVIKKYCKSILRVVSCDFNSNNPRGRELSKIQDELLENRNIIETVFRPSAQNKLVTNGIVVVKKTKFLRSTCLASIRDESLYLGRCETCPDMCGVHL